LIEQAPSPWAANAASPSKPAGANATVLDAARNRPDARQASEEAGKRRGDVQDIAGHAAALNIGVQLRRTSVRALLAAAVTLIIAACSPAQQSPPSESTAPATDQSATTTITQDTTAQTGTDTTPHSADENFNDTE
jgi:hypothetical protein